MTANLKRPLFPDAQNTATGAYSPGLCVGELVFVSGQGPLDPDSKTFQRGDIEAQTTLTLGNVAAVLRQADCSLRDVVKVTVHLQNINDFDQFNSAYMAVFQPPYPARTTVQSVLAEGISIEIDAIAVRGCGGAGGV